MGTPSFSGRGGGARIGQGGHHLTAVNTLSTFGRFNKRGGGGCCPLSADLTSKGGGGAIRFCLIQSVRCPPSRPIQSYYQWAEGAELLLQGGGGGGGMAPPP